MVELSLTVSSWGVGGLKILPEVSLLSSLIPQLRV